MRPALLQRQGAAMRYTGAMTEGTDVITTTLGELIEVARAVSEDGGRVCGPAHEPPDPNSPGR